MIDTNYTPFKRTPKLYQELLSKHDGHAIPAELKTHLIRFHKIADKAAQEVADTFIENAKYTGAANEHGILNHKQALLKLTDSGIEYAEIITENKLKDQPPELLNVIESNQGQANPPQYRELPPMPDAENIKIPLTEKKVAFLAYPQNIKKRDIEILRKQLDLLELLAE